MLSKNIPLPIALTSLSRWIGEIIIFQKDWSIPLPPETEEKWKEWVYSFYRSNPEIANKGAPLPQDTQKNWREWAEQFLFFSQIL